MIRKPAVAGAFYPASKEALGKTLSGMIDRSAEKTDAVGLISPHAGYVYSGPVAGATISRVTFQETFIILGPNHTGLGEEFSLWSGDAWETPLGTVEIDNDLRQNLLTHSRFLKNDTAAHLREHSIEVQLPFLQFVYRREFKIVPIVLGGGSPADYRTLGQEVAQVLRETGKRAVILASSDMTHYEPQESASRKDKMAIEAVLKLDAAELVDRLVRYNISMCGYAPALVLIAAARELGASYAELVKYQTSGDVTGDFHAVVGYAGIIVKKGVAA
jgi:AmmeMemoRadiSam system protein B